MLGLFRQFSTPGGIPSHVGPTTPGSIHEGGELGYVLTHAFGAVFDNPGLLAVAVIGDGEAETAPLEGSWKGIRFLNAARDGAVLPILHLNGYKIAGPTVLGRASDDSIRSLLEGHGYAVHFVEGNEPAAVHRALAATLETCLAQIRAIQADARTRAVRGTPRWPTIVMRTPKGWTGPKEAHGLPIEGTFRAHQVPLAHVREDPTELAALERWMKSYRPEELFDDRGRLRPELRALAPKGPRRMGANPHANGGCEPLVMPDIARYALAVERPGVVRSESTRAFGALLRDVYVANPTRFRLMCPDETNSNRLGAVFEVENRCFQEPHDRDRRSRVRRGPGDGGADRAQLRGLARGLRAHRPPRGVRDVRGVRADRRVDDHAAREVARDDGRAAVARTAAVAQLPADVDVLAQRPQRVLAPGPRLHGHGDLEEGPGHPRVPAARRQLPAVGRGPLPAQRELREPDHHRQAAAVAVARSDRGARALRARRFGVDVGGHRARR